MPTTVLSIGPTHNILQNVVYALPAKQVIVTTGAACETSVDGTNWTALTSGSKTGAKFLRCTSGNTTVTCSAAGENPSGWSTSSISFGSNPAQSGAIRMSTNQGIRYRASNQDWDLISTDASGSVKVGNTNFGLYLQGTPVINNPIMLTEGAEPGNAGNIAQFFCKDNGSGKTQLMVKFGTGAAIQLAIEP